jgi:hypothetical protein
METSIQDCMKIISEAKEKAPNDPSSPFKEKEKGGEGRSMLGGQWKVPCLVANGRFHVWWPMECSMLGGQWNVSSLVAMECEGETFFHLFHFPPNNLYPNLQFFPLTLRFYFTMVLSRYSGLPCRNPTLAKCGGEAQHLEKVGIGVVATLAFGLRLRQGG